MPTLSRSIRNKGAISTTAFLWDLPIPLTPTDSGLASAALRSRESATVFRFLREATSIASFPCMGIQSRTSGSVHSTSLSAKVCDRCIPSAWRLFSTTETKKSSPGPMPPPHRLCSSE
eukprot:6864900-Prymnesium_polylepis.1